ncbi:hypothetical protein GCM10009715_24610 [Paeniglutamicibacter psychrophenolicus]|uniref:Uncharacterized protein n=1 Tax=Paeniglutamicibacter psychrophenolicus TaxID=257454 RepID=A0ABS4WI49_9MICC|nr:hypothetical protein [Paeniglutamicibacter psychrophenolicus]MBP2375891.1 hypothetical protein [Paeniglutamicibacter psychrophenolicus]
MNTPANTRNSNQGRAKGALYSWIGFATGIACMAALIIFGLVKGNAGMVVMGSSTGAMLGALWASTSAATRKKAPTSA